MGLELVELMLVWEKVFEIDITDLEAETLFTPRKAIDLIYNKLNVPDFTGSKRGWSYERVREEVRKLIREHLGVKNFSDDDEFVKDLGIG